MRQDFRCKEASFGHEDYEAQTKVRKEIYEFLIRWMKRWKADAGSMKHEDGRRKQFQTAIIEKRQGGQNTVEQRL